MTALDPVLLSIKIHFHQINSFENSFEAYKSFCENYGNDSISFRDFDFWWYRFKEGKFGLDYDRSKDPKKPELFDIPSDILEEIIEKLEWTDRCIFRKVSKSCRSLVDHQKFVYDTIELGIGFRESVLNIDNQTIFYRPTSRETTICEIKIKGIKRIVCPADFEYLAIQELCLALINPNLEIKRLTLIVNGNLLPDCFRTFLKTLNHQVHVKSFHVSVNVWDLYFKTERNRYYQSVGCIALYAYEILPYLKPRVLENIEFSFETWEIRVISLLRFHGISCLEQWKQAKQLKVDFEAFTPIEQLLNFSRLNLHANHFSKEHVEFIEELASKSTNFESCRLTFVSRSRLEDLFGTETLPFVRDGLSINGYYRHFSFEKV